MIPYILHVSILLGLFYTLYWLLLRKETFFKLNRVVLLLILITSLTLPLIPVPSVMSLHQPVVQTPVEVPVTIPEVKLESQATNNTIESNVEPAVSGVENTSMTNPQQTPEESTGIINSIKRWNVASILWAVYLTGVIIFILTFFIQFFIIILQKNKLEYAQDGAYRIYEMTDDNAPFSFLNWIFINPALYDLDTYDQIIEHEKIHISQSHFIDKLLAEFAVVFFWFNPFSWFYRKAITNNLEYLTDEEMLQQGTEREGYQMNLLKVSVPQHALNLTTNYNQSFLKQRIKMMNTKKSSARSSWKYLLLLPMLVLSMATMNAVIVDDENTDFTETTSAFDQTENLTTLKKDKDKSGKKNKNKTKHKHKSKHFSAHDSIPPHEGHSNIYMGETSGHFGDIKVEPGHWVARIMGDQISFYFNNSTQQKRQNWHIQHSFNKSEISDLPFGAEREFRISREAGTLVMNGRFVKDSKLGEGSFKFEGNQSFAAYLKNEKLGQANDKDLFLLFLGNINKSFVAGVKSKGYKFDLEELVGLGIHGVDMESIDEYHRIYDKVGHKGRDIDDLMGLAIHGVSEDFTDELLDFGFTDVDLDQVLAAQIHNVNLDDIKSLKVYGFESMGLDDFIGFAIHNVNGDYIEELKELGYTNLTPDQIQGFAIHGVNTDFMEDLNQLGYANLNHDEIMSFAIHGVDIDQIEEFKKLGYSNLTPEELINVRIHGVTTDDIEELKSLGYTNLSFNRLVEFSIHGINARYIGSLKDAGFDNLSEDQIISGKIHGVNGKYINELKDLGFKNLSFDDLITGRIHGINKRFVEKARKKGHNPETFEAYVNLKIHGI